MYTCFNCNTVYELSFDHLGHINIECEMNGIVKTLVLCPECYTPHIVGGEVDWDEAEGRTFINMFSQNINHQNTRPMTGGIMAFEGVKAKKEK